MSSRQPCTDLVGATAADSAAYASRTGLKHSNQFVEPRARRSPIIGRCGLKR